MSQQVTKFTTIDLQHASFKIRLYLNKIVEQPCPHAVCQKICHLAVETYLKFGESEQLGREIYDRLKSLAIEKKNYYALYIVDCLVKNNKYLYSMARRDLENMFKAVWQKTYLEIKKDTKIENMKAMLRTWGVIFPKKFPIEDSIKRWLQEKYTVELALGEKNKAAFEQNYEKFTRNNSTSKIEALISELNKQEHTKSTYDAKFQINPKLFQD